MSAEQTAEQYLSQRIHELDLPEGTTWSDINRIVVEEDRKKKASLLGLPTDATWDTIRLALKKRHQEKTLVN